MGLRPRTLLGGTEENSVFATRYLIGLYGLKRGLDTWELLGGTEENSVFATR